MKIILQHLKPYRLKLVWVAIADAIGMLLSLFMPYIMTDILEDGIAGGALSVIIRSAALMLILSAASLLSSLTANKINSALTTGFTADLCRATFKKINSLTYESYSKIGPSGLLTRSTDDIFNIEGAASSLVYTLVTVPIMLIGSTVLSFSVDPTLSLIFICAIPPVILVVFVFMRPLYSMWDKSDAYVDEQNKIVRERLSGIRVVRAFNNEAREHSRAKFATEEMAKYMIRANVRGGFIEPIAMLLLNLATVVLVAVGGARAESGLLLRSGAVVAVIQYVTVISGALINLSWTIAWLPRLRVSIRRINEVHSLPTEESVSDSDGSCCGSELRLDGVTFTYPGASAPSLHDVSIEVGVGERVAIIGGTGAGKTTLIRLLLGLFRADGGSISLGGVDYRELTNAEIRSHYSAALQRGMIFEGTVRDNIGMGCPEASEDEILHSLRDSQMGEFVDSHTEGLDYLLIGSGRNVSGGQKQRLNIARAIIRDADIYLFDDSFSALDFLTERIIREELDKRLFGKSRITVTQRVSTALGAERIYVMDKGRIVGSGTHAELVRSCEVYREICISQLGVDAVGGDTDD